MSKGRILVTYYDPQSRTLITAFLECKRYEVRDACDAEQALEISGGNKRDAAALLCIKRTALIEKLKK